MATITEDYVSFETAKLLKEKGFYKPCYRHYDNKGDICGKYVNPDIPFNYSSVEYYLCPSQAMVMKWLRKIYGIDIVIEISDPSVKDRKYYCVIWDGNNNSHILDLFNSNEEACEAAIKYCLGKII